MRARLRLSALSPFGPIFGKELRATARRRRNYFMRVLYLVALLLTLMVAWAGTSNRVYSGSVAAQAQAQAELGAMFFVSFSMFSVVAMAAIGPVLTSTAVSAERLGKTLAVLLMTPVNNWQIISGKLFSRLLVALTLVGLSLPVLALVRLLGGVELGRMAGIVLLCASTVLFTASVGLLFSCFMNRAYAVILLSYAALLLLYGFVPFVMAVGLELNGREWMPFYAAINPFFCAAAQSIPGAVVMGVDWWPCVVVHAVGAGVFVWLSGLVLRRVARRAGEGGAPVQVEAPAHGVEGPEPAAPATPPPLPASPPARRARRERGTRDVSDRPVLWREVRRPMMAKPWQAVVGSVATVALLLITYASLANENELGRSNTQIGYAVIFNGLLWLLVSVLSATAIAQEKESDTWTLLLTTPLAGHSIVWGKVLGLYRRMLWPSVLIATHFLLFTVTRVIDVRSLLVTLWVMFSFNTIWVATGMFLSLAIRKVTFAVIVNLLLAVAAYLGVFVVLVIIGELSYARRLAENVGWYLPYYYLGEGMRERWENWRTFDLPDNSQVDGGTFAFIAFAVGALHVLLSYALLRRVGASFDRIVGRAGQWTRPSPLSSTAPAPA